MYIYISCSCAYFNFEMGFKLQEHWINSQDPAAPQSNSSCLEIDHFRKKATGRVKLGQRIHQNCLKKNSWNPVVPSELECIV